MNPVQQKIKCVYVTEVTEEPTSKRSFQTFKVSATGRLSEAAQKDNVATARATEKLDGTCCLVERFQGKPWLWARHDRRPSKVGEKRLAQFRSQHKGTDSREPGAVVMLDWDPVRDFKQVPPHWVPADRLEIRDEVVIPDDNGHTPGWVPVDLASRQHCWHASAVDLSQGVALVLREEKGEGRHNLVLESQPLSVFCGQTCELIGTNINGNPYGIGDKKHPIHVLVPHGSLLLSCPPPADFQSLHDWFDEGSGDGHVEGVVWHCSNGELYKLHRHHLNLQWPISKPRLCQRSINVQVVYNRPESNSSRTLEALSLLNGQTFDSLKHLSEFIQ